MFPELLAALFFTLLNVSAGAYRVNNVKRIVAPNEGDVRLSGSTSTTEGRVEVYHNGEWGTVCDDDWDLDDAQVVCRQLNFQGAISAVPGGRYGRASGQIWLDNVNCYGTEQKLASCRFPGWGNHDCSHTEDAGVICEPLTYPSPDDTESHTTTLSNSTYSLDHSTALSDDLGKVFDSGAACDYLITFQTPARDKQEGGAPQKIESTICAHKAILMLYPYFNASAGGNNTTVTVDTPCLSYFTSFIRYLYTRKINVTYSSAMCLHQLAADFGVWQLREDVGQVISKSLPNDASFYFQVSLYKYAVESKDSILKESCIQYLAWNFQSLTTSPVWAELPVELLQTLLTRSDLVVPDEYFVLEILESWITNKTGSLSSKNQVDLLRLVRFPMIPAEKLNGLLANSSLSNAHRNFYRDSVLKAYQFNVLLFSSLTESELERENDHYKRRIYTGEAWSRSVPTDPTPTSPSQYTTSYDYSYDYSFDYLDMGFSVYGQSNLLQTPLHNSLLFRDKMIRWETNVFKTQSECSKENVHCHSVPAAMLVQQSSFDPTRNIRFDNRVLLKCQNRYICHIQAFAGNMAYIPIESLTYPCPDGKYVYTFVVRPEYV